MLNSSVKAIKTRSYAFGGVVSAPIGPDIIQSQNLVLSAGPGDDQLISNRAFLICLRVRFLVLSSLAPGFITNDVHPSLGCRTTLFQTMFDTSPAFSALYLPTAPSLEQYQILYDDTKVIPGVFTGRTPPAAVQYFHFDDFTIPLGIPYQIDGNTRNLVFVFDFFRSLEHLELYYNITLTFQDN